jgi:hypothetical protein
MRHGTTRSLRAIGFVVLDDHRHELVDGHIAFDQWFFNSLLTLPWSGRFPAGCARFQPPLMSNVDMA